MRDAGLHDKVAEFADGVLELLWPARCVGCDLPQTLLCPECESKLELIDQRDACPRCGAPHGRLVCTECAASGTDGAFSFTAARAAGVFEGILAQVITCYKDSGERRLAGVIARLLAIAAGADWRSWADAVVFVPAAASAVRRRGFDHMELVARKLGGMCAIPVVDALICTRRKDQRLLGRAERAENMSGVFELVDGLAAEIADRRILLVDDVFTTGATLDGAAKALLAAGAHEVRALVAARVW